MEVTCGYDAQVRNKEKIFAKKKIMEKNRSSELLRAKQNTEKSEAEAWPI